MRFKHDDHRSPAVLFSTEQACNVLGISRTLLIDLVSDRTISAIRVGRSWKFKPSALRKFVDGEKEQKA